MDRLQGMLCGHALKKVRLRISGHTRLVVHCDCLPSESLAGLDDLQIMEAAHVQTQLQDILEPSYRNDFTHPGHQTSHAGSDNSNFCVDWISSTPLNH
jgi:hypothetical protein